MSRFEPRRFAAAVGAVMLFAACGDSDTESASTTTAATQTSPTTTAVAGTGGATTGPPAGANQVAVQLSDRSLSAPTSIKAGTVNFVVTNAGRSDHELLVIKGTYATAPKQTNGAVIENQLAAGALIGRTAKVAPDGSTTASFSLTAGQYVLLCNITSGPNSHAGQGQVLDIDVA